jgi:hypothetical protein
MYLRPIALSRENSPQTIPHSCRSALASYCSGYPTVWARRVFCSGRRFIFGANWSFGTIPRTTVFSPSEAQKRYTFWVMQHRGVVSASAKGGLRS